MSKTPDNDDDDNARMLRQPGRVELTAYRWHGSGVDLFRAYTLRRKADKAKTEALKKRLLQRLNEGLPREAFDLVDAELVMLNILDQIDPVISDLLKLCEHPPPKDDALANLRSALRLGKGRAPQDARTAWQTTRAVQLWIEAYNEMRKALKDRSAREIAREIGGTLQIDWRTALRYWERYTAALPHQARWVKEIRHNIQRLPARSKRTPKKR